MKNDHTCKAFVRKICMAVLLCVCMAVCAACSVKNIAEPDSTVQVFLEGGTEYQIVSVFGRVIKSVSGVQKLRLVDSDLVPDSPHKSKVAWTVNSSNDDTFGLQTAIMDMMRTIIASGGQFELQGKEYNYAPDELVLLKGIRPGKADATSLKFIVDRELMRTNEWFGR